MKILFVEDDTQLAESLIEILSDHKYEVVFCADGQSAIAQFRPEEIVLAIVDLNLPDIDGVRVCRRIRGLDKTVPILAISARDTTADKVTTLDAGADDYMVKPFDPLEFLARVRSLLRRAELLTQVEATREVRKEVSKEVTGEALKLVWRELQLDPSCRDGTYNTVPLNLAPREFQVLEVLVQHYGRPVRRAVLLEQVWGEEESAEDALYVTVNTLREKLKRVGAPSNFIETVYRVGYRLRGQPG